MRDWDVLDFISHSRHLFDLFLMLHILLRTSVKYLPWYSIFYISRSSGNFNWITTLYALDDKISECFLFRNREANKMLEIICFSTVFRYVNEMLILTLGLECYLVAIGFIWRLFVTILDLFTNATESAATTTSLSSLVELQFN